MRWRPNAADKAFSGQRFSETGQDPWREMREATRRFVEAGGGTFPATNHDAACPMGQQDLDGAARERMAAFEEFVRRNLSQRIVTVRADIARQAEILPHVSTVRATCRALDGASEELRATAQSAVDELAQREQLARLLAASDPGVDALGALAEREMCPRVSTGVLSLRDGAHAGRLLTRLVPAVAGHTAAEPRSS